jgi:hypothetical protein
MVLATQSGDLRASSSFPKARPGPDGSEASFGIGFFAMAKIKIESHPPVAFLLQQS